MGGSGRLTTSVARTRTVAGRGRSVMMPSSIGVGACPHSGNAGRGTGAIRSPDWAVRSSDTPDPPVAPTDCLTATYTSQEANGAQPVRLSTRSLAPGFAWHQRRPGFPADYRLPCNWRAGARGRPLLLSLLLCQEIDVGGVVRVGRGRLEEVPDAAGVVAFEAAEGFAVGLAFFAFAAM